MLIQTHVENAIKHGLLNAAGKGILRISCLLKNESVQIEIEDNGIGRANARIRNTGSTGKGLHIMEKYFEFYRIQTGKTIKQQILDLYDDYGNPNGTKILIEIPVAEKQHQKISK